MGGVMMFKKNPRWVPPAPPHIWNKWKTISETNDMLSCIQKKTCKHCGKEERRIVHASLIFEGNASIEEFGGHIEGKVL